MDRLAASGRAALVLDRVVAEDLLQASVSSSGRRGGTGGEGRRPDRRGPGPVFHGLDGVQDLLGDVRAAWAEVSRSKSSSEHSPSHRPIVATV